MLRPYIAFPRLRIRRFGSRAVVPVTAQIAPVLPDVAPITAYVVTVLPQVAAVAAHFMTIPGGIARVLRVDAGGGAERQRQQGGDERAVFHGLVLEGLCVVLMIGRTP